MNQNDIAQSKGAIDNKLQNDDFFPVLEAVTPAKDDEIAEYHKKLHQYFLSGQKTTESLQIRTTPLIQYLQEKNWEMPFPAMYDHKELEIRSFTEVLQNTFCDIFDSVNEALKKRVFSTFNFLLKKNAGKDPMPHYSAQVEEVVKIIREFGEELEEPQEFNQQCDRFEEHLLAQKVSLIGFSTHAAFQILNIQLKKRIKRQKAFLQTIKKSLSGLNEVLELHSGRPDNTQSDFAFADELLSFDNVTKLTTEEGRSSLPEERMERLRHYSKVLSKALKTYSDHYIKVFVTQKLADEYVLQGTLSEASLEIINENLGEKAAEYSKKEVQEFVQIIAAIRLAKLEMNYEYDNDLHDPYFEGFDLTYLSDEDIQYFPSLIVIEESQQLIGQPKGFLEVLSNGNFVKVLAINRLEDITAVKDKPGFDERYLELAAMAMFHRNVCVFQGGSSDPVWLSKVFQKGLEATSSSFWNILFAKSETEKESTQLLALKSAIESRFFPGLVYDFQSGGDFGSHFDLKGNLQPEQAFPSFELKIKSKTGEQLQPYRITPADFLALSTDYLKMLEIVPPQYQNDKLISFAEYLTLPQDALSGKVPFVWLVDEKHILRQAAIPVSWFRRCKERLDYWSFMQEVGGLRNTFLKQRLEEAKSQWEASKEAEIEALKTQLQAEFEQTSARDLERAITNILNRLLGSDTDIATLLNQASNISFSTSPEVLVDTKPQKELVEDQQEEAPMPTMRPEAWVESDQCTSCSDCIDALPGVFKYNSDKQAFVHNPKGGSYAKIVATAEKCPARCIHPGLPHDSDEPELEKLVKRAEKYN